MSPILIERLKRLSVFSKDDYLRLNPDVEQAGVEPFGHALSEGRPLFARDRLARVWGEALSRTAVASPGPPDKDRAEGPNRYQNHGVASVFVHSASHDGIRHLASRLAGDLAAAGFRSSLLDEGADPEQDHGSMIFVAPHQFFAFGFGQRWARAKILERSFVFNTRPLDSPEFSTALPHILAARGILDSSPQMVDIFRQSGLEAFRVELGAPAATQWLDPVELGHPLVAALPAESRRLSFDPETWDERPIDVAFFGRFSPRRSDFFSRHASTFAPRAAFLYLQQGGRDALDEAIERRTHFRIAGHIAGNAKITLQIQENEFHHFDWHGCMCQTMASGSLTVSDFCPPHPLSKPGIHLFEADTRHIPDLLDWLLSDRDGRQAARTVQANALSLLKDITQDGSRLAALASFLSAPPSIVPDAA